MTPWSALLDHYEATLDAVERALDSEHFEDGVVDWTTPPSGAEVGPLRAADLDRWGQLAYRAARLEQRFVTRLREVGHERRRHDVRREAVHAYRRGAAAGPDGA